MQRKSRRLVHASTGLYGFWELTFMVPSCLNNANQLLAGVIMRVDRTKPSTPCVVILTYFRQARGRRLLLSLGFLGIMSFFAFVRCYSGAFGE